MEGLVSNLDIFVFMKQNSFEADILFQKVLTSVKFPLTEEEKVMLKSFSASYTSNLKRKWRSANSTKDTFLKKFADWLDSEIKWPEFVAQRIEELSSTRMIDVEDSASESIVLDSTSMDFAVPHAVSVSTSTTTFTPRKQFANLSPLQKRRRTEDLIAENDFNTLAHALAKKAEIENKTDFAELLKHLIKHPEDEPVFRPALVLKKSIFKNLSADKALGLSTSLKLSKWQYRTMRQTTKYIGCNIYPSYDAIKKEKEKCYVDKEEMVITEAEVKLKLQSVLDLTVKRIFKGVETDAGSDLTLTSKWGFDGASGQSNYKQKMDGEDSSIFMCSFVPLKLREIER